MEIKDKTFRIFDEIWKIKFVEGLKYPNDDADSDTRYTFGITDSVKHIIKINTINEEGKPHTKEVLQHTLAHELVHAFLDSGQYIQSSQDEPMVEWLGRCVISIIKQKIL